jgi:hypothetical protein
VTAAAAAVTRPALLLKKRARYGMFISIKPQNIRKF